MSASASKPIDPDRPVDRDRPGEREDPTHGEPALLDAAALRAAVGSSASVTGCGCARWICPSWESVTECPGEPQFERIGTLRVPGEDEPTLSEWHPQGTRYGSARAPISVRHFPFNRCEVWRCRDCGRGLLQYTEYGGYYIDHRIREIDPGLVCD